MVTREKGQIKYGSILNSFDLCVLLIDTFSQFSTQKNGGAAQSCNKLQLIMDGEEAAQENEKINLELNRYLK